MGWWHNYAEMPANSLFLCENKIVGLWPGDVAGPRRKEEQHLARCCSSFVLFNKFGVRLNAVVGNVDTGFLNLGGHTQAHGLFDDVEHEERDR